MVIDPVGVEQTLLSGDVVIVSPGVPRTDPLLRRVRAAGVPVTSGTQLWLAEHGSRTIAVTGSKGKSTTTSLLAALLTGVGVPCLLGGNIGVPLLDLPPFPAGDGADVGGEGWYVVELSSFQAATVTSSPWGVIFTALFPDHLSWHGGIEPYYADKLNLVAHGPQMVVAPSSDLELRTRLPSLMTSGASLRWVVGDPRGDEVEGDIRVTAAGEITVGDVMLVAAGDLPLSGWHNARNAGLAVAMLGHLGVDVAGEVDRVRTVLTRFEPLPHRLQTVHRGDDMEWVDDGLATTPQATIAALETMPEARVAVVLGGADRGVSYAPLAGYLTARIAPVLALTVPDNGPVIQTALKDIPERHRVVAVESLEAAVTHAVRCLPRPGIVLLSPAAPSFGRYRDYTDRSAHFAALARATH